MGRSGEGAGHMGAVASQRSELPRRRHRDLAEVAGVVAVVLVVVPVQVPDSSSMINVAAISSTSLGSGG